MQAIELIGSHDGGDHYNIGAISQILSQDMTSLAYGSEFVGRPNTRIYSGEQNVVKLRSELSFNKARAVRWINTALQKERELGVHHPHKTWFLIDVSGEDNAVEPVVIGNICPRLQPIHTLLEARPDSAATKSKYHGILHAVFDKYLNLAKRMQVKLDEGLSNFGVDVEGKVFYLDDEYYVWDNFVSFSIMLGVYIRTYAWLDQDFIERMGRDLANSVDAVFEDPHCNVIVAEQLRSLFMPSEEKTQLVRKLIDTLLLFTKEAAAKNRSKRPGASGRSSSRYFALLADIHANYPALERVLGYLKTENIQEGIILGDIVGYGPDPAECIERLQDSSLNIIKGNHDHAAAINKAETGFSHTAKAVIKWTVERLSEEHRDWLKYLPAVIENDEWLAVHGAPIDPTFFNGYVYSMTAEDNLEHLQNKNRTLCFHGHSHMPGVFARDKRRTDHHVTEETINLDSYKHALVCPGSVGQPRNGKLGTQFAIYDREKKELSYITLPYEVEGVVKRMRDYELPESLWQRLLTGT
ncbi:metallophosphoesterase family protein [Methylomicrobium sp. Wu6]|uniref:metallophosphoesterase family protein n=1 Tax=Methylomicrobium sp. Wu6 TaxID=3107928 RepID=UPI002DD637F7|nr:metallophosphoesterase family protein [Methylomicrobium sp. Wu6]MEC4750363.1 metallophosphoesterase family protein [Methylomicrobium sp. Wu6]